MPTFGEQLGQLSTPHLFSFLPFIDRWNKCEKFEVTLKLVSLEHSGFMYVLFGIPVWIRRSSRDLGMEKKFRVEIKIPVTYRKFDF
jgi:hypothetical protein